MKWSLRLGSVAGIAIYVHWTFLLLIGWIIYLEYGSGLTNTLVAIGLILLVFVCVVLHELGHALTARRFGVRTRDIILLPIGGVARLEKMPEDPTQELLVAIAGPAVNVVIAAVLGVVLLLIGGFGDVMQHMSSSGGIVLAATVPGFIFQLLAINVFLVLFNAIPAFPMDGGRILRAALAHGMNYQTATSIAAVVGQVIAVLFFFVGLFINPFLSLIGVFVFLGARAEAHMARSRGQFERLRVAHAMMTRFETINADETLGDASRVLLAGSQQDFPVMRDGELVGMLFRSDLMRVLIEEGRDARIGDAVRTECLVATEAQPLREVVEQMQQSQCSAVPVLRQRQLVGLLTLDNVQELLAMRPALALSGR